LKPSAYHSLHCFSWIFPVIFHVLRSGIMTSSDHTSFSFSFPGKWSLQCARSIKIPLMLGCITCLKNTLALQYRKKCRSSPVLLGLLLKTLPNFFVDHWECSTCSFQTSICDAVFRCSLLSSNNVALHTSQFQLIYQLCAWCVRSALFPLSHWVIGFRQKHEKIEWLRHSR